MVLSIFPTLAQLLPGWGKSFDSGSSPAAECSAKRVKSFVDGPDTLGNQSHAKS
jgi:hypothetical protein